jgi:hypothetical protein
VVHRPDQGRPGLRGPGPAGGRGTESEGPALGRPLLDRITRSSLHHLKELRPASAARSEIRVLFAFDPTRSALLLLDGDKSGNWKRW